MSDPTNAAGTGERVELLADPDVALVAPASHSQRRVWFFEQLGSGSAVYNIVHAELLSGLLDATALQKALDELVRRHEALRTTFRNVRGLPYQVVWHPKTAKIARFDCKGRPDETQRLFDAESARGFDLERGPLCRFTLIETEARQQMLIAVVHHSVFDLLSVGIFSREFNTFYEDFKAGRSPSLHQPALAYSAYISEQNQRFATEGHDPQVAYWTRQLAGVPAISEFPTDRPRPPVQTYPGAMKVFRIAPGIASAFQAMMREQRVTLFMGSFAAYAILLHRYAGQTDLAIGTPIANRGKPGLEGMLGFLLNMLVLRIDFADDPSVAEVLARARAIAVEAFDHQDVPFEVLIEAVKPPRDPSRSPFFQNMLLVQSGNLGIDETEDKHVPWIGAKYDLTLIMKDAGTALWATLEYNTDLFEAATIDRLAIHFQNVLAGMATNPSQRVSQIPLIDASERRQILVDWNTTRELASTSDCLHHLFEGRASARPNAIAVSHGAQKFTYAELDRRADALAALLRAHGMGAGTSVGICMDRSLEWIVAVFAVLKSGAAMVPLDRTFPPARLTFMIDDSQTTIVLTQSLLENKVGGAGTKTICLNQPLPEAPTEAPTRRDATAQDLAYVAYTSGSTGRPKGVLVQHDSVVNFIRAQIEDWSLGPGARVLQFTAFGFDIGLSEIFLTLCSGAEFCLAPSDDLMTGPPLLKTLRALRITHVTLPPSALAAMQPESLPDLKLLISAGEPCEPDLARRWAQGSWRIVNAYGPTEATIYATIGAFDPEKIRFPLGRVIPNYQVYILDRNGAPVPPGVTGEIHIGGIGVARGYLNRPDLTEQRFIPDRFSERPDARLYRTGDFGRFDAEGTLHYLGRADTQLKVRGYRIEPGEIESVMRQHPQVRDALVLGHGRGPDARLIAYYIPQGTPPLVVELRGLLARHLPEYMAPAAYIKMDAWPKNANGKIDRPALPRPETIVREVGADFAAPSKPSEVMIADVWRECLGVERVGASDNFFDLGGHSLLLVRAHDLLREKLKVDLTLIDMFRLPTVKLLAAAVDAKASSQSEHEALGRTDLRAARQNAARLQRRQRVEIHRHA